MEEMLGGADVPGIGYPQGHGYGAGVTFIPSLFGSPHLVTVHAPGWRPVVQYPVAEPAPRAGHAGRGRAQARRPRAPGPAPARARPRPQRAHHRRAGARLGPDTSGGLPPRRGPAPRRIAHRRAARPLRALRRGLPALTALGTDLLAAVLR